MMMMLVVFVVLLRAGAETAADKALAAAARMARERASKPQPRRTWTPPPRTENPTPTEPPTGVAFLKKRMPLQSPPSVTREEAPKEETTKDLSTSAFVYRRLEQANTSALLELMAKVPLRSYELEYDAIGGRRQIGVVGEDLESLMPEAVHIGRRAFPNPTDPRQPPIYVENFKHVDLAAVFTHNLGATQELANRQFEMEASKRGLDDAIHNATIDLSSPESGGRGLGAKVVRAKKAARDKRDAIAKEGTVATELKKATIQQNKDNERLLKESFDSFAFDLDDLEDRLASTIADLKDASRLRSYEDEIAQRSTLALFEDELRQETEIAVQAKKFQHAKALEVLKHQAEIARLESQAQAKAEAARRNEDVRLRALRARAAQDRRRFLDAIAATVQAIANGATALFMEKDFRLLTILISGVIFVLAGGFFSREAATLARQWAEAYFGKPRLVRETSRKRWHRLTRYARTIWWIVGDLFFKCAMAYLIAASRTLVRVWKQKIWRRLVVRSEAKRRELAQGDVRCMEARHKREKDRLTAQLEAQRRKDTAFLDDVILDENIKHRLIQLAVSTRHAKKNRAPFRHVLLHGPPGTGKTLAAKKLAAASGLEYALMSGGDVAPLGADGVTAIHALFKWANTSDGPGVLVFVDEAEAFLATRSNSRLTEHMRNALNAFLYQTGSPTPKFLLVLATNRANDLDDAVLDRIDETLYFGLPEPHHRDHLVSMYLDKYVRRTSERQRFVRLVFRRRTNAILVADDVTPAVLGTVATMTEGFSAREIEKLMVAVQGAAYGDGGRLDASSLLLVVRQKIDEHRRKAALTDWTALDPVDGFSNDGRDAVFSEEELSPALSNDEAKSPSSSSVGEGFIDDDFKQEDPEEDDIPEIVQNATVVLRACDDRSRSSEKQRNPFEEAVHATVIAARGLLLPTPRGGHHEDLQVATVVGEPSRSPFPLTTPPRLLRPDRNPPTTSTTPTDLIDRELAFI